MSAGPKLKTKSFSLEPEIGLYFFFSSENIFSDSPGAEALHWTTLRNFRRLACKRERGKNAKKDFNYTTTQGFHDYGKCPFLCVIDKIPTVSVLLSAYLGCWSLSVSDSFQPVACLFFPQHLHLLANSAGFHELPNAKVYSLKHPRLRLTLLYFTSFRIDLESLFQEPRWHSLPLFIKRLIIEAIMGVSAVLRNAWTKMQLVPVCREWMVAVSLRGESWFFGLRLPSPDNLYFWKLLRRL